MTSVKGSTAIVVAFGAVTFFTVDWVVDRRGGKDRKAIAAQAAGAGQDHAARGWDPNPYRAWLDGA